MRELTISELNSVNGGLGTEDVIFGSGSAAAGALGAEATMGSGMFAAAAGGVGVAAGVVVFGAGWLVGTYAYNSFANWYY